jgi:ectoine hydroxylase-related dioxygenase (phytanoyl-CoA dioxygenase family)
VEATIMNDGYKVVENFLKHDCVNRLEEVLVRLHESWREKNLQLYNDKAINSAYLTKRETCPHRDRMFLFKLIGSKEISKELETIFDLKNVCFLNTQLFFDPFHSNQKNYWHRDIQYSDLSISEQKREIETNFNNIVHFRIATRDENGIELVPGTNKRWDSSLEYETRFSLNGRKAHHELPQGKTISLSKGDLLIFSANMIHRGLYGKNRLALDILFCNSDPQILSYADLSCYPEQEIIETLENQLIFKNALAVLQA